MKAGKFEIYFGVINEDLLIKRPWEWKKENKKIKRLEIVSNGSVKSNGIYWEGKE